MKSSTPRIEISLSQIRENTQILSGLYLEKGISLMGVTKAVLGEPSVAKAMIEGGVKFIADSRIKNILKMKNAGISIPFVLLCTVLSQAESIVQNINTKVTPATQDLNVWHEDLSRFYQPLDPYILRDLGMDCALFNDSSVEDFDLYLRAAKLALDEANVPHNLI